MTFDAFDTVTIQTSRSSVFARWGGSGPPVLLLHGFPETHLMWRAVAPLLAREFAVVCPDLPGYGRSGCPASADDHAPYAKRAMARDLAEVMEQLGFARFGVAGHDRGGRVAYRLALDHPERVRRLAVLDIVPARCWSCGAPTARWAPGTPRRAARWGCGVAGRTTSAARLSRPAISSPRSFRTRPRSGCAASWR
jgi:pimeloyl-ACP methyl ester carboxylesterase